MPNGSEPQPGSGSSIRVKLEKRHKTGLGIGIKSADDGNTVISSLLKGGVADESGLVRPGDFISRINDIDITRLPYSSVKEILEAIPYGVPVILLLNCPSSLNTCLQTTFNKDGMPYTVRITKPIGDTDLQGASLDENRNQSTVIGQIQMQQNGGTHLQTQILANQKDKSKTAEITAGSPSLPNTPGSATPKSDTTVALQSAAVAQPPNADQRCPFTSKKYQSLQFLLEEGKTYRDTLHKKAVEPIGCGLRACTGSILSPLAPTQRTRKELVAQAEDFIEQYYTSIKRLDSPAHKKRLEEVLSSIEETGSYDLTTSELTFGAKTAWRNASRCIGRIQWSKLQLFDARHIGSARGMFDAICNHIRYATNKGVIRSALTIFPARRPVKDGEESRDFRVWNVQLIGYAAYRQTDGTIRGDKARLEFTELCERLGWRGSGGDFDVLPLVLQANGQDPELFELPPDLVLQVHLKHPDYPWFEDLGLKWYAVPAVANMQLDVGGLQFTGAPFNGWYMASEIGARDLCDPTRYDMTQIIAEKMGLGTQQNSNLWKDQAMLVANVAVLYSFQSAHVSITEHHSTSESFMKHYESEVRVRGGCPADWVWIVPPLSGSLSPLFHLEMLNYKLKPSYEYQDDPWKTYIWKKDRSSPQKGGITRQRPKISFKELAKAVRLTAKLMSNALAKRVKCTILYATETGRSERYANTLCQIFKNAFDAKVYAMHEYHCQELEHETLVLAVTSTFGNGDPPDNGSEFAKMLYGMVPDHKQKSTAKSTKHLTLQDRQESTSRMDTDFDNKTKLNSMSSVDAMDVGPLSNVSYSVFALGSTAYPNFCAFGRYMDNLFGELGAEQIFERAEGDELCGQDQSFNTWAQGVFKAACDTFCLGEDVHAASLTLSSQSDRSFRLTPLTDGEKMNELCEDLSTLHSKRVIGMQLASRRNLQSACSERETILVQLEQQQEKEDSLEKLSYNPGDHVAVYPANNPLIVMDVIRRLKGAPPKQQLVTLQWLKEKQTPLGPMKNWIRDDRLPEVLSLERALSHYLDVSSCPAQSLLEQMALTAQQDTEKHALMHLAKNSQAYERWRFERCPSVADVLAEFPSVEVSATLLLSQLPILQPRYYSISSCLAMCPMQLHATVAVVKYMTPIGTMRHGLCSSWLNTVDPGAMIPVAVRSASSFHMPANPSVPIIMVGPGSGIAPFRSFWQKRTVDKEEQGGSTFGRMDLYFGCRQAKKDLVYRRELDEAKENGVMQVHVALSREPGLPKMYVQDLLQQRSKDVAVTILKEGGHFYVCGDVTMAQNVGDTLEKILSKHGDLGDQGAAEYVLHMKEENRYHEDIFGVTLRTSAVLERIFDESVRKIEAWSEKKRQFSITKSSSML